MRQFARLLKAEGNLCASSIYKACSYTADERFDSAEAFLSELKQVSSLPLTFLDTPSKAVCNNTKCPSAAWSSNGYYKGPYFIEKCTNLFCTSCGNKLLYKCKNCNSTIEFTMFCGSCGQQQFGLPECKNCGSYLKIIDMETDTKKNGCEKCKHELLPLSPLPVPPPSPPVSSPQQTNSDNDIPF